MSDAGSTDASLRPRRAAIEADDRGPRGRSRGSGFDASILCLFGSLMIPSKFVSGSFVICISPQMPSAGLHSFSIVQRGHRCPNASFLAIDISITHTVSPSIGVFGRKTLLYVMGTGFAAAGIDYFCRLNNISVMANVLNSTCMACSVTVFEFGLVAFSVESLVPTQNRMMFSDIRRPKFVYVQPSLGPMNGGTIVNFFVHYVGCRTICICIVIQSPI